MTTLHKSSQAQLNQLISQIENLEEEKKALASDVSEKYKEAKASGFDTKAMKKIVKLRKLSKAQRDEEDAILTVYMQAVGLLGTPLGEFADRQDNVVAMSG